MPVEWLAAVHRCRARRSIVGARERGAASAGGGRATVVLYAACPNADMEERRVHWNHPGPRRNEEEEGGMGEGVEGEEEGGEQ